MPSRCAARSVSSVRVVHVVFAVYGMRCPRTTALRHFHARPTLTVALRARRRAFRIAPMDVEDSQGSVPSERFVALARPHASGTSGWCAQRTLASFPIAHSADNAAARVLALHDTGTAGAPLDKTSPSPSTAAPCCVPTTIPPSDEPMYTCLASLRPAQAKYICVAALDFMDGRTPAADKIAHSRPPARSPAPHLRRRALVSGDVGSPPFASLGRVSTARCATISRRGLDAAQLVSGHGRDRAHARGSGTAASSAACADGRRPPETVHRRTGRASRRGAGRGCRGDVQAGGHARQNVALAPQWRLGPHFKHDAALLRTRADAHSEFQRDPGT
ncbi:hypothetical protein VTO73DRAFT_3291 [Trametes versicolor]